MTEIGDHNVFMAYAHIAHDCHVGNHTIFGNAATLGGHVTVEDYATISAFSGVHQFCRVGQVRVHRRILGHHQGRLAVCEDRRQPRADLRPEHDRARAPEVLVRLDRQAAPRVPATCSTRIPAARSPRSSATPPQMRRSAVRRRLHPIVDPRSRTAPPEPAPRGSSRGRVVSC